MPTCKICCVSWYLSVATAIAAVAMTQAVAVETVPETWIGFGALGFAVGVWRRNRWWREGGNLVALVGAQMDVSKVDSLYRSVRTRYHHT